MNIIYLGRDSFKQDVVNYEKEFLDGTHTEALYLAEFLVKHSETRIYCSVKNGYSNDCGIQFLPYSNFYQDINSIKIDNIFIMCNLSSDELLSINANRIYLLLENEWFCSGVTEENINHIYKIGYLSEYQKNKFIESNPFLLNYQEKFLKWFNAVDETLYKDIDFDNKRKAMIASSNYIRCGELFEKNVFPLIKEKVPEFTLYYCDYGEKFTSEHNITDDDNGKIIDLGCIDKKTLSEYQKRCSVWGYLNLGILSNFIFFHETFCNTAVENAMAGNAIVCLDKGGLSTTLRGYPNLIGSKIFNEYNVFFKADLDRVYNTVADEIIKLLTNKEYWTKVVKEGLNIANKYTKEEHNKFWENELSLTKNKYRYSIITFDFDDYEILREVDKPLDDVEYIYVTNNKDRKSNTWKVIYDDSYDTIENSFDKVVEFRKRVLDYCNTDICCRIDGSIKINGDAFENTITEFNKNKSDISFIIHPVFRSVKEEYRVWTDVRGLDKSVCDKTVEYMVKQGYDVNNSCVYTLTMLIQRNNEKNRLLNEKQYEVLNDIKKYSCLEHFDRCDQAVFTYVLDTFFKDINVLPLHFSILERKCSSLFRHKSNNILIVQKNATFQMYYNLLGTKLDRLYDGNKWLKLLSNDEIYNRAKKILLKLPHFVYNRDYRNTYEKNKNSYNVIKDECDVITIGSNNTNDYYFNDPYNKHHFTVEWYYNKLLPIIESQLNLDVNLGDFKKVYCENMFCYVPKNTCFYEVYCPKIIHNDETGFAEVYYSLDNLYNETSDSIVFPESVYMNAILNYNDPFHRMFKYSHLCCKIKNPYAVTDKTLLLITNSHSIPFISIFAYYYKTLIIIDNRLIDFNFDFLYSYEDITDILMLMSYDNKAEKFLNNTNVK